MHRKRSLCGRLSAFTYNLGIGLYALGARVAALFGGKAAKLTEGHREVFGRLRREADGEAAYVWFHAASLGEFEQGRPLLERFRREHPGYKILLTFFSPSGYEVRKNYEGADIVCYLPFDTPRNARRFIGSLRLAAAFFIKYEFWQNYLCELRRADIPAYSVASTFRPDQVFFRWYGRSYRRVLECFECLFVQDEASRRLLADYGIRSVCVAGDTRFDRVLEVCARARRLPLLEAFRQEGGAKVLVAGSSWEPDEELLVRYFNEHPGLKLVIAPHVVNEARLRGIVGKLRRPCIRYSEATEESVRRADCLFIDGYGFLSSVYRYGEVAYVGGGFGVGIHNILEAAVYDIPVLFGPNNKKFHEAQNLLAAGGAFEVSGYDDFRRRMDSFLSDESALRAAGRAAGDYVRGRAGAVERIAARVALP